MAEARRSTTRSQRRGATAPHRPSQCSLKGRLSITWMRSSPGTASNRGAEMRPTATLTRTPGWRSMRWRSNPVESTASPIRVAVMNRRPMAERL